MPHRSTLAGPHEGTILFDSVTFELLLSLEELLEEALVLLSLCLHFLEEITGLSDTRLRSGTVST